MKNGNPESAAEARELRKTAKYQRMRLAFLKNNPLCEVCKAAGIIRVAQELDHVEPVKDAPARFWDVSNFAAICRAHHELKSAAENSDESPERAAWRERIEQIYGVT